MSYRGKQKGTHGTQHRGSFAKGQHVYAKFGEKEPKKSVFIQDINGDEAHISWSVGSQVVDGHINTKFLSKTKNTDFKEGGFDPKDAISTYTSNQAVEDGALFDLEPVTKRYFKNSPFSYVTTNLMGKGYMASEDAYGKYTARTPNIVDLVMAATKIFLKMPKGDRFASGQIELPSGDKQKIFIAQNETGRFTIMLPEDY